MQNENVVLLCNYRFDDKANKSSLFVGDNFDQSFRKSL